MRDSDIRKAVKAWLEQDYADDPSTRIVEEMGIWNGSARVDIAVINGELHGIELKSAKDTLERLQNQADLYNQVFDRVTLVADRRHIEKAISMIPQWWDVVCAVVDGDAIRLQHQRTGSSNPGLSKIQLARLLWRAELIDALDKHKLIRGYRSKSNEILAARLAKELTLQELTLEVRGALKSREMWLGQTISDKTEMSVS